MGTASYDPHGGCRELALLRASCALLRNFPAPLLHVRHEQPVCDRNMDNPHHRHPILNQRYVNGKFAVSFDKLLCSVKGVYKPEPVPVPPDIEDTSRPSSERTGMSG